MSVSRLVGASVQRREDPRLITGRGRYVDDLRLPDLLHVTFVRSIHAHARVNGIDVSEAEALPGVVASFVRADIEKVIHANMRVNAAGDVTFNPPQFPIAGNEVVFQGEVLAIVAATSKYAAEDAATAIQVDYEPLPVVVDMMKGVDSGGPKTHDGAESNIAWDIHFSDARGGDISAAFAEADVVVKERIHQQRVFPLAMEGRGVVAAYEPFDDLMTIWISCQAPHFIRRWLAEGLRMPEAKVRVISNDVGGGFGAKIRPYPEDYLVAAVSKLLRRPVKWIESRTEGLTATTHGRAEIFDIEVAAKRDGTLLGLKATQYQDLGAYIGFFQTSQPIAVLLGGGCYEWKAIEARSVGVLTNTTSTDPYRGAGRPEAAHLAERAMDLVAREIQMDPAELRKRNFIQPNRFPFKNNFGIVYDSGDYERALEKALDNVGYKQLRQQQLALRRDGRYIGIGISSYVEICGFGPSKGSAPGIGIGLVESASVSVDPGGAVTVYTGTHATGQGHETSFAQLVSDTLGVPYDEIVIRHGDTGEGPALGLGTYGSRSLAVGGIAILRACVKVVDKAKQLAAQMLEAAAEDIVFEQGRFYVKGSPDRIKTMKDVAAQAYGIGFQDGGGEHGLEAIAYYDPPDSLFPFGTHIAVVEVDTDTGAVNLQRYVAVDDCGNVLNPRIVDGQIQGGITQGIGQALYEEVVYDEQTGQLRTGSLTDYLVPTANEVLDYMLDRTVTPTPHNELGVKGVGEAGTIGSSAAVINAVCDALAPFGINHVDMPASPDRIWRLIQAHKSTSDYA
jgi:aerobic carbon-monoxide dehydrogenase large subunit